MFPRSVFFSMGLTCTTPWMDSVGCNDVAIENWFKKRLSEKTKKTTVYTNRCLFLCFFFEFVLVEFGNVFPPKMAKAIKLFALKSLCCPDV